MDTIKPVTFKGRAKRAALALLASASALAVSAAHAAADTTAIDGVKTDMLAYGSALLGLAVAVWGAFKIVRLFGSKGG